MNLLLKHNYQKYFTALNSRYNAYGVTRSVRSLLLACMMLFCCTTAQEKTHQKKTIIISFNVLYRPNENKIEKHVRSSLNIFRAISLLFSGIPSKDEIKQQLFSILEEIPLAQLSIDPATWQSPYKPWDVDYAYPPTLNQLITSSTREQETLIYNKVTSAIRNHPHINTTRKIILKCIADFLYQSKRMNDIMEPVESIVKLLKKLKQEGHTIILVAGVPAYAWDTFLARTPQAAVIKELFSDEAVYVSGHRHVLQTSEEMYTMILQEHGLEPRDCIVIAHNTHDLRYPKEIGMHTLVYHPSKSRIDELKQKIRAYLCNLI